MKFVGPLLFVSGWAIVLWSLHYLPPTGQRSGIILAGAVMVIAGLQISLRAFLPSDRNKG
jgi:hypothetical protein